MGGLLLTLAFVSVVSAADKLPASCQYIKDGTIKDKFGEIIPLGYNDLGYNYQAHMFNGMYCDAYANADWCQQFTDIRLMMKWNDAWLANYDCGTQGADQGAFSPLDTPDTVLDRHYPTNTYIGSGAWLTNHAEGTYISSTLYDWNVTGTYTFYIHYSGKDYYYNVDLTQSGDAVTGTLTDTYLSAQYPDKVLPLTGTVTGDDIVLDVVYPGAYWGTRTYEGTIDTSGALSGTWSDSGTDGSSGTWSSTEGSADKVYRTCTVSDFVKIVAAPSTAYKDAGVTGYYNEGMWYTDITESTEIGPVLWGNFAVIQEQASDPCSEYGVIDFFSPFRKGLGNWAY